MSSEKKNLPYIYMYILARYNRVLHSARANCGFYRKWSYLKIKSKDNISAAIFKTQGLPKTVSKSHNLNAFRSSKTLAPSCMGERTKLLARPVCPYIHSFTKPDPLGIDLDFQFPHHWPKYLTGIRSNKNQISDCSIGSFWLGCKRLLADMQSII